MLTIFLWSVRMQRSMATWVNGAWEYVSIGERTCGEIKRAGIVLLLAALLAIPGCGGSEDPEESEQNQATASQSNIRTRSLGDEPNSNEDDESEVRVNPIFETENTSAADAEVSGRTLGHLLDDGNSNSRLGPPDVDEDAVLAAGIQKLEGKYLDLYTDVRDPMVQELVDAFDQAVPQWSAYFELDVPDAEQFHVRGNFIQDKDRFLRVGLLPDGLPPFEHGYQEGFEFWVYPKPGPYFSRHQFLHEGTHAFMRHMTPGMGPPWFMEGIAELLACHRWEDNELTLYRTIQDAEEAPYWGRVKIVQDAFRDGTAKPLEEVLFFEPSAHRNTDAYGWSWAACAFFDGHPVYGDRFRALVAQADDWTLTFSQDFVDSFGRDWPQISCEWQVFVSELDYGYDVERAAIRFSDSVPLLPSGSMLAVRSDRGWQSTGITLQAGRSYRISADGQVQVADDGEPWMSESPGITIEYYRGTPLGMLVGAIRSEESSSGQLTPLVTPFRIGNDLVLTPDTTGILFLRINDSPMKLSDNSGSYQVTIREE